MMEKYFKDNNLDQDTTYGLDLEKALQVGKKIFYSEVLK